LTSWQRSRSSGGPRIPHLASKVVLLALFILGESFAGAAAADEPCNPIIDGTYCATNMPRKRGSMASSGGMKPLEDLSRMAPSTSVGGTPGTLFGIGVQGHRTCFGLLRRSNCD
jgi:hypothetical protein